MALNFDLAPGDILVVPPDSGAHIRVAEKTGRRTRVVVESAKPVQVLRARDEHRSTVHDVPRPKVIPPTSGGRPKS